MHPQDVDESRGPYKFAEIAMQITPDVEARFVRGSLVAAMYRFMWLCLPSARKEADDMQRRTKRNVERGRMDAARLRKSKRDNYRETKDLEAKQKSLQGDINDAKTTIGSLKTELEAKRNAKIEAEGDEKDARAVVDKKQYAKTESDRQLKSATEESEQALTDVLNAEVIMEVLVTTRLELDDDTAAANKDAAAKGQAEESAHTSLSRADVELKVVGEQARSDAAEVKAAQEAYDEAKAGVETLEAKIKDLKLEQSTAVREADGAKTALEGAVQAKATAVATTARCNEERESMATANTTAQTAKVGAETKAQQTAESFTNASDAAKRDAEALAETKLKCDAVTAAAQALAEADGALNELSRARETAEGQKSAAQTEADAAAAALPALVTAKTDADSTAASVKIAADEAQRKAAEDAAAVVRAQQAYDEAKKGVSDIHATKERLQREKLMAEEDAEKAVLAVQAATKVLGAAKDAIPACRGALETATSQASTAQAEHNSAEKAFAAAETTAAADATALRAAEQEDEAGREGLSSLKDRVRDMQEQKDAADTHASNAASTLQIAKDALTALESDLISKNTESDAAKAKVNRLTEELSALNRKATVAENNARPQLIHLRKKQKDAQQGVKKESPSDWNKTRFGVDEKKLKGFTDTLNEVTDQIQRLNHDTASKRTAAEQKASENRRAQSDASDAETEYEKAVKSRTDKQADVTKAQAAVASEQQKVTLCEQQLREAQRKVTAEEQSSKGRRDTAVQSRDAAKTKRDASAQAKADAEQKATDAESHKAGCQQQVTNRTTELTTANQEQSKVSAELEKAKMEAASKAEELTVATENDSKAERDKEKATSELTTAQTKMESASADEKQKKEEAATAKQLSEQRHSELDEDTEAKNKKEEELNGVESQLAVFRARPKPTTFDPSTRRKRGKRSSTADAFKVVSDRVRGLSSSSRRNTEAQPPMFESCGSSMSAGI